MYCVVSSATSVEALTTGRLVIVGAATDPLEVPALNPPLTEASAVNYAEWRARLADALVLGSVAARSDLRIRRTGKQIEFILNGQPAAYTKAVTSEEAPFYFGAILDNGMQCEISAIEVTQPTQ